MTRGEFSPRDEQSLYPHEEYGCRQKNYGDKSDFHQVPLQF